MLPPFSGFSDPNIQSSDISLTDAQSAVALEYGFASWAKLKRQVESLTDFNTVKTPHQQFAETLASGDSESLKSLFEANPDFEQQIREALLLKSRFHNLMSLEFPNRIASIKTDIDDLLASGIAENLSEPQRDYLEKIKTSFDHLTELSNHIKEKDDSSKSRLREVVDALASEDLGALGALVERHPEVGLEIQEAAESTTVLRSHVTHEVRTPINSIIGHSRLILREREESERLTDMHYEGLGRVLNKSEHFLSLINDLLDLTNVGTGRMNVAPEVFDVAEYIDKCISAVSGRAHGKGLALKRDVPDDIGQANTDGPRLRQVLYNLLSNALKFTDKGGVTVTARKTTDDLLLSVSNTGRGIPADALSTIFDETRHIGMGVGYGWNGGSGIGLGLGLSLAQRLVELLGGEISVEREVGKGSTFTVRVPMVYQA